jgi:hypothetical protein
MKRLGKNRCINFLESNNIVFSHSNVIIPQYKLIENSIIPIDSGNRINLVMNDMNDFKSKNTTIIFSAWSIWPSGEYDYLFKTMDKHYGFNTNLINYPCYQFKKNEYNDFLNYCVIGIIFLWDFFCFVDTGELFFYSHDEFRDKGIIIRNK